MCPEVLKLLNSGNPEICEIGLIYKKLSINPISLKLDLPALNSINGHNSLSF